MFNSRFSVPNEEVLHNAPLFSDGLKHCSVHEIKYSTWIKEYEKLNSIHPYHNPETFMKKRHFFITFHDSTFECIADNMSFKIFKEGSRNDIINELFVQLHY